MQVSISGPKTQDIVAKLEALLEAATLACQAYAQRTVKDMQAADASLQEMHRKRQRLESEVRALEERKKKALQPPADKMKQGTQPLTQEQQAAHKAKVEAERAQRKAAIEAQRKEPLKQPIKGLEKLAEVEPVQATESQQ